MPCQSNLIDIQQLLFSETTNIQTYLIYDKENHIGVIIVYEMISTFIGKKFLRIEDVYLEEQYRGNGVGEIKYKFIVEIAKKNDCHHIDRRNNDKYQFRNVSFYQKT